MSKLVIKLNEDSKDLFKNTFRDRHDKDDAIKFLDGEYADLEEVKAAYNNSGFYLPGGSVVPWPENLPFEISNWPVRYHAGFAQDAPGDSMEVGKVVVKD